MYIVLVGSKHRNGKTQVGPDAMEGHIQASLDAYELPGATVLPGVGLTKSWGREECSVIILVGCGGVEARSFAITLGHRLSQESVGLIRARTEFIDWIDID